MKIQEYAQMCVGKIEEIKELATRKGKDYANEGDTLKNFKVLSELCRILDIDVRESGSQVAMFFVLHKMSRLSNLKGRAPANEAISDTESDLLNYLLLYMANKKDEGGK